MSMDKWEEAAGTAALNIGATRCSTETLPTEVVKIRDDIVTAHSDLRRTFSKLVELIALKQQKLILASAYMTPKTWAEMNESEQGFDLNLKVVVIESDPDVIEAMKGEEG